MNSGCELEELVFQTLGGVGIRKQKIKEIITK